MARTSAVQEEVPAENPLKYGGAVLAPVRERELSRTPALGGPWMEDPTHPWEPAKGKGTGELGATGWAAGSSFTLPHDGGYSRTKAVTEGYSSQWS